MTGATTVPDSARLPSAAPALSSIEASAGMLAYRPGLSLLTTASWGVMHAVPAVSGLLMRDFFDALAGDRSLVNPWLPVALTAAVAVVRLTDFIGAVWVWATLYFQMGALLRRNALRWIVLGEGVHFDAGESGEALTRFREDVDAMVRGTEEAWIDGPGVVLYVVVALGIMVAVNPWLTLATVLPIAIVSMVTSRLRAAARRFSRAAREATAMVTEFTDQMFGAVQVLKVRGVEARAVRHLDGLNARRRRAALRDTLFGELVRTFGESMGMVGIGVVLVLGASSLRDGTVSVGDMALFMTYVPTVAGFAGWLGRIVTGQRRMGVSVERMQWLLRGAPRTMLLGRDRIALDASTVHDDTDHEAVGNHGAPWPEGDHLDTVEVRGLTAHHSTTRRGIEGATFALRRGTVTVVAGRVGSGKTTLLRAVLGLMPRLGGEVRWNGAPVAHLDRVMVPPRAAYVPQVPRLFSETLRENVCLGATVGDDVLVAAIRDAMLEADVATLDRGLDTLVGPRGVRLSGGQVQRAATARALVRRPDLLVVDDLSSALDVETEGLLWDRLCAPGGPAVLAVSNRRVALRRATQVLLVEDGRVVAQGTLDEVLAAHPAMRDIWDGDHSAEA